MRRKEPVSSCITSALASDGVLTCVGSLGENTLIQSRACSASPGFCGEAVSAGGVKSSSSTVGGASRRGRVELGRRLENAGLHGEIQADAGCGEQRHAEEDRGQRQAAPCLSAFRRGRAPPPAAASIGAEAGMSIAGAPGRTPSGMMSGTTGKTRDRGASDARAAPARRQRRRATARVDGFARFAASTGSRSSEAPPRALSRHLPPAGQHREPPAGIRIRSR